MRATLSKDHSLVVTKEHGSLWYHVGNEYSSCNWQWQTQKNTLSPLWCVSRFPSNSQTFKSFNIFRYTIFWRVQHCSKMLAWFNHNSFTFPNNGTQSNSAERAFQLVSGNPGGSWGIVWTKALLAELCGRHESDSQWEACPFWLLCSSVIMGMQQVLTHQTPLLILWTQKKTAQVTFKI